MSSAAGRIVQIWGDESLAPLVPKVVSSCLQGERIIQVATQNQRRCAQRCAKLLTPRWRSGTTQRHSRDAIQVTQLGTALALREVKQMLAGHTCIIRGQSAGLRDLVPVYSRLSFSLSVRTCCSSARLNVLQRP